MMIVMKRFYLLIIVSCICMYSYTQEYRLAEIEDIAYSFFNDMPQYAPDIDGNHPIRQLSSIEAISRDSINYMYIANAVDSAGWIIMSNEKTYPCIIALCDSGTLTYDQNTLPPALLHILEQHMDAIDSTRANNFSKIQLAEEYIDVEARTTYTSPIFLKENYWQQYGNNGWYDCDKVYNKFVPASHDVTCGRALVGCGAVAMAQIMQYWQWPDYAFIKDTIIGGVCHGNDNQRFYDWAHMPNMINESTDIYEVDAVAGLLRDCAYAANTIFWGDAGSSALIGNINGALQDEFGFHTKRYYEYVWTDMEPVLCQEIDANRPVLCQAWKTVWQPFSISAHTFIMTGYKKISINDDMETLYYINWGWGYGYNGYVNLDFNGYDGNRTFLTEIYPKCDIRSDDVSLINPLVIMDNQTYYSTNNVVIGSNSNSVIVEDSGHLLVKAGNETRIKSGFHAKPGSNIRIMTAPLCYSSSTTFDGPQRLPSRISSASSDETYSTNNVEPTNRVVNAESEVIISTSIYTISGQLIQTIYGGQHDATHLPNGMYILQHRMSDGSVRSEKIANNK